MLNANNTKILQFKVFLNTIECILLFYNIIFQRTHCEWRPTTNDKKIIKNSLIEYKKEKTNQKSCKRNLILKIVRNEPAITTLTYLNTP